MPPNQYWPLDHTVPNHTPSGKVTVWCQVGLGADSQVGATISLLLELLNAGVVRGLQTGRAAPAEVRG